VPSRLGRPVNAAALEGDDSGQVALQQCCHCHNLWFGSIWPGVVADDTCRHGD